MNAATMTLQAPDGPRHDTSRGKPRDELRSEFEMLSQCLDFDGARVLELGCGAAEKTREIADRTNVREIVAAEVDAVQHAKNLASAAPPNIRFADFGAEAIDAADADFDIVLMFKSLHHVPTDRLDDALREIRRVLRPGGLAYISEPVFAGDFNEVLRLFHDEETVRRQAFEAVRRAVQTGLFELAGEHFFLTPIRFESFAQFEQAVINTTHTEHRLDAATAGRVRERFESFARDGAYPFEIPNRLDLLRRPAV